MLLVAFAIPTLSLMVFLHPDSPWVGSSSSHRSEGLPPEQRAPGAAGDQLHLRVTQKLKEPPSNFALTLHKG